MNTQKLGSYKFEDGHEIIDEINHLINFALDKEWMKGEWQKLELGEKPSKVHPLVSMAFKAHQQIEEFISQKTFSITEEIFELTELAKKINNLRRYSIIGLEKRLSNLTSMDFKLYRTARYEIQIAGMLLQRGHSVSFIEESSVKTPDILVTYLDKKCEIECKHKDPEADQLDYIRSIYNTTQKARKQFSKTCAGIIMIEIDKLHFNDFKAERERLKEEIFRAMRASSSISAILLTSIVLMEDGNDYIYRHLVFGYTSRQPRYPLPDWLAKNLVSTG